MAERYPRLQVIWCMTLRGWPAFRAKRTPRPHPCLSMKPLARSQARESSKRGEGVASLLLDMSTPQSTVRRDRFRRE